MTRFAILTIGSHGDVRPYVALGVGLKKRGHSVVVATNPKDRSFCETWGLKWMPLTGDLAESPDLQQDFQRELDPRVSGFEKFRFFQKVMKEINRMLDQQLEEVLQAAKQADVILYSRTVSIASHVAESLKKPAFLLQLQPEVPTVHHASSLMPSKPPFGKLGNWSSHWVVEQMFWQPLRKKINAFRTEKLGLPKVPFLGPSHYAPFKHVPQLIAVSPAFIPSPKDWKPHVHMTGFLHLEAASAYTPPPHLEAFLQKGEPPLYIGFGSMEPACPPATVKLIQRAAENSPFRLLISNRLQGVVPSDRCLLVEPCPHDWLFPRVAAAIHHGGIGTTAACLKSGTPTLVLPFVLDQFFWGTKLFEAGVGPKPLPLKSLTEKGLQEAIHALFSQPKYRQNARELSKKIANENGVEKAIQTIEELCGRF